MSDIHLASEEIQEHLDRLVNPGAQIQRTEDPMMARRVGDSAIIEDLIGELKETVLLLRDPNTPKAALYKALYDTRWALGQVTARYGMGLPPRPRRREAS